MGLKDFGRLPINYYFLFLKDFAIFLIQLFSLLLQEWVIVQHDILAEKLYIFTYVWTILYKIVYSEFYIGSSSFNKNKETKESSLKLRWTLDKLSEDYTTT